MKTRIAVVLICVAAMSAAASVASADSWKRTYGGLRERVMGIERVGGHGADVTVRVKSLRQRDFNIECVTVTFSNTRDGYPLRVAHTLLALPAGGRETFTVHMPSVFSHGWPQHIQSTCGIYR